MSRSTLLALVGAALIVAGVVTLYILSPGRPDITPDERAALIGRIPTVGYGETVEGVTVRETGTGAVFEMPGGREVSLAVPEGHRLTGEFAILNPISGGAFLAPEGGGTEVYVTFIDARRRLEPEGISDATATYTTVADQLREQGMFPFLDSFLPVLSVEARQDGVFYCLDRGPAGQVAGASRFVGPLNVTVMAPGDCAGTMTEAERRLDLAEAALAPNRQ